jgi:hypothetical protein
LETGALPIELLPFGSSGWGSGDQAAYRLDRTIAGPRDAACDTGILNATWRRACGGGNVRRRAPILGSIAVIVSVLVTASVGGTAGADAVSSAHLASITVSQVHVHSGDLFTVSVRALDPTGAEYQVELVPTDAAILVGETCGAGINPDTPSCEYHDLVAPTTTSGVFTAADGVTSLAITVCVLPLDSVSGERCRSAPAVDVR